MSDFPNNARGVPIRRATLKTSKNPSTSTPRVDMEPQPTESATIRNIVRSSFKPAHKLGPIPGVESSLLAIVRSSPLNVLLLFVPVVWALHFASPNSHTAIFIAGCAALISLAQILAFATDDLSLRVRSGLAELVKTTLGNAAELIVAFQALRKCELGIVQSSLVGSILINLLFVLGMCFCRATESSAQGFAAGATQLDSAFLFLPAMAMVIPTAYHWMTTILSEKSPNMDGTVAAGMTQAAILKLSRGIAIIMLLVYVHYLFLKMRPHTQAQVDQDDGADAVKSATSRDDDIPLERVPPIPHIADEDQADEEHAQIKGWVCAALLTWIIVAIALVADLVVDSIAGITASGQISKELVGLILLPVINAVEHRSAVAASIEDLSNAVSIVVGSSIQTSLYVIPYVVIVGWGMGKPMTLFFDPLVAICPLFAVIAANCIVRNCNSLRAKGGVLIGLYIILGAAFVFYHGMPLRDHFAACT
ncbi:calcium/proton exchanger [Mycena polygramma]|nr:calcium/proton exchanger [Mycena polygramma]